MRSFFLSVRLKSSLEDIIATRTRTTRSVVASLFVAALALTGCSAAEETQTEGAEQPKKIDATRIDTISPASGSLLGGETITFTGQGLDHVSSVVFGGVAATSVTVVADSQIQVVAPAALDYAAGAVSVTASSDEGEVIASAADYDYQVVTPVDAQMQYAFAHWQDYNEVWGVFPDNDCGNFVNQTLIARGWEQTDDWYSEWATTGDFSDSWARGPAMDAWFASQTDRATRLSLDQRDQVKVGDVVMFDWDPANENGVDHTMLVSKVDAATGAISMVGHTIDAQYRDLDQAITIENPGATAWFYSIA
ncbi:IPT/TIG domain-containing protein [Agreia bicolorata]|uniref:IPT/TIG domain-containing protein n=1 Tax=Agreia bicolorata TaxID=110935 RepID=A0A1T4WT12_9MICO|nr:amidase domain-containing protein [Agreia bicolorata]SKA80476.1 IPT/TIG domain-containing protein [Agreia bicolorata]